LILIPDVAFGDAATHVLEAHLVPHTWNNKLSSIIAYYPSSIPAPGTQYSASISVLVHLASGSDDGNPSTVGVSRQTEVLGLQGKRRTVQKRISPGTGAGGLQTGMSYRCYTYEGVDAGFAERDLPEFDGIAESVAFERSLATVRQSFGGIVEQERPWEQVVDTRWRSHGSGSGDPVADAENITKEAFVPITAGRKPHIALGPTLTGGVGKEDILKFYGEYFLPANAEEKEGLKLKMKLLSRTVGTDRLVDELYLNFVHSAPVDWMLPDIPATNKKVEIIIVCIVGFRAGKIWCEHLYWDQASVLVQVGLLDVKLNIPEKMQKKGVERLPVLGKESARGILNLMDELEGDKVDDEVEQLNRLLRDW
jgi:hypothetical protein